MSEQFKELTTRTSEPEAQWIAQLLEGEGIRVDVRPSFGGLHGVFGISQFWPHTVFVLESDYARAGELLAESEAASVDLDWDEVDVGEPEDDLPKEARPAGVWARRAAMQVWLVIPFAFVLCANYFYAIDWLTGFGMLLVGYSAIFVAGALLWARPGVRA